MPPRKRTAKAADDAAEDAAKPGKRQKKTENTDTTSQVITRDAPDAPVNETPVASASTFPYSDDKTTRNGTSPDARAHEEDDEDEDGGNATPAARLKEEQRASDLYLDTVNRAVLDFDFEKVCSVSLSNINIYACLVCGKYFQGRSKLTPAFAHSIHDDHHVFINLETLQVYVLPDGYKVSDPSLDDISRVLAPKFTKESIAALSHPQTAFDLQNEPYAPGYIGLNNIKANDYANVIIHALLHVPLIRDPLLASNYTNKSTQLLIRFATLAKKLWNSHLFKAQVSPHEFLQEVTRVSAGKFGIMKQGDPVEFLGWLLNALHKDAGGTKRRNSSMIYSAFQGELRLDTQQVIVKDELSGHVNARPEFDIDREIKSNRSPFLFLAIDLPPPPLFQDAIEAKNIIPQVSIYQVLAKYDGSTAQEYVGQLKRFKCQRLPPYIILHFKRFTKNNFVEEKNPTIVNFPLKGLDFREYVDIPPEEKKFPTTYNLLANITHESTAGTARDKENTAWKITLRGPAVAGDEEQWYSIQDLIVQKVQREMIFLGETVLQVWERDDLSRVPQVSKSSMDVDS